MSDRSRRMSISSGGPWEGRGGYSRAVRVGDLIFVSGSTAMHDGELVGRGDVAAQTRRTLETIRTALDAAGATLADVVRYRIFLTNIADHEAVIPILGEYFRDIRPAGTLVAVAALIHPDMLIEIEVDAIAGSAAAL